MSSHQDPVPEHILLDRAALRSADFDHYGSNALHGLDPSEIVCRIEEQLLDPAAACQCEREALRREILSGFIEYCFADGPDPQLVRIRLESFICAFSPTILSALHGPTEWVTPAAVRAILRKPAYRKKLSALHSGQEPARLSAWTLQLDSEVDSITVRQTISAILALLIREAARWKTATACAFALAKAYHPHLLAGMSLEDIATLCGDSGGRATPSDRIRRMHNRRIEAAGAKATNVPFQKTTTTIKKYRFAQQGNQNRKKPNPRKK